MEIVWYALITLLIISLVLVFIEAKKAPLIDDSKPFLHDDYDPRLDPSKSFKSVFCEHCTKNIDGIYCNNGVQLSKMDDQMFDMCKKEGYFEAK